MHIDSGKAKRIQGKKKKDAKALLFLQQGTKTIFPRILAAKKSTDAWRILKEDFQGSEKAHEEKMSRFTEQSIEQAFQSKLNVKE